MDLDLTEAVEAAARAAFEANSTADASAWADVDPMTKYRMRQAVLPSILAAAPAIARQVREQIAQANRLRLHRRRAHRRQRRLRTLQRARQDHPRR